jgi:ATP-dependent RNA/DNA helicase IGHMBP2
MAYALRLVEDGVQAADIGIITPYNAQVKLLRDMRPDALRTMEISSVDGFQGAQCHMGCPFRLSVGHPRERSTRGP